MKQKFLQCLRPRLALLLVAVLLAAMAPDIFMTAEASEALSTWEERDDVKDKSFSETGTSLDTYTYYNADGTSEEVTVNHDATVGTKENPISISSEADLILFGQQESDDTSGKYYILDKTDSVYDMDGDNYSMLPLFPELLSRSSNMSSIRYFKGVLIGNGATIDNVAVRSEDEDGAYSYWTNLGLFGWMSGTKDNPCEAMDLTVNIALDSRPENYEEIEVSGFVAFVEGYININNLTVNATFSEDTLTYDAGTDYEETFGGYYNCNIGGLISVIGYESVVNINACDVTLDINSATEDANSFGGLIGITDDDVKMTNCNVNADIIQAEYYAGGLVAVAYDGGSIDASNCTVSAENGINVTYYYSNLSYTYSGTLLGYAYAVTVAFTNCTADTVLTYCSDDNNEKAGYYPKAAVGYIYNGDSEESEATSITYTDTVSNIKLSSSSDVTVALVNGTELGTISEESGSIYVNKTAGSAENSGCVGIGSNGNVGITVNASGTKNYVLTDAVGIIYLEDNTDDTTASYWVTLDADFTDESNTLNKGDGVNLLAYNDFRYTVYFYDAINDSYVDSQTVASGSTVTEPTSPSAEGYTFEGWYTDSTYENEWSFDSSVTKSTTLYARYNLIIDIAAPTAIENLTYTGEEYALVNAGEVTGGTMYYSLTGNDDDWSTDVPTAANAGAYTVYYKVTGNDGNDYTPESNCISVTIGGAEQTVTVTGFTDALYDGEAHEVTVTAASDAIVTITYTDADGNAVSAPINVGAYTAHVTVTRENYTAVEEDVTVSIAKASQAIFYVSEAMSKTVGDTEFMNELTKTTVYGAITYVSSDTSVATVNSNGMVTIVGAGTATITAEAAGGDNYTSATASYTLTVNKASVTVTVNDVTRRLGNDNPDFDFTITDGALLSGDTKEALGITLSTTATKASAAGAYAITGTYESADYDVTIIDGTLTVIELTELPGQNFTDGMDHSLSIEEGITEVPEALQSIEALNTVEKIENVLRKTVIEQCGYDEDNAGVSTFEVTLMVSRDGGLTWEKATEENFPEDGLTVILPYPEGTGKDTHDFAVTHMFTTSYFGKTPGDTENPTVTKTDDGIQVTLTGLSPIAIAWTEVAEVDTKNETESEENESESTEAESEENESESTEEETTTVSETEATTEDATEAVTTDENADTGDTGSIFVRLAVMLLAVSGIIVTAAYGKKRKYN